MIITNNYIYIYFFLIFILFFFIYIYLLLFYFNRFLYKNELSGPIPSEIGNLTNLKKL